MFKALKFWCDNNIKAGCEPLVKGSSSNGVLTYQVWASCIGDVGYLIDVYKLNNDNYDIHMLCMDKLVTNKNASIGQVVDIINSFSCGPLSNEVGSLFDHIIKHKRYWDEDVMTEVRNDELIPVFKYCKYFSNCSNITELIMGYN